MGIRKGIAVFALALALLVWTEDEVSGQRGGRGGGGGGGGVGRPGGPGGVGGVGRPGGPGGVGGVGRPGGPGAIGGVAGAAGLGGLGALARCGVASSRPTTAAVNRQAQVNQANLVRNNFNRRDCFHGGW